MINALVHPRVLVTLSAPAAVACTTGKPWALDTRDAQSAALRATAMHGIRRPYGFTETRPRGTPPV